MKKEVVLNINNFIKEEIIVKELKGLLFKLKGEVFNGIKDNFEKYLKMKDNEAVKKLVENDDFLMYFILKLEEIASFKEIDITDLDYNSLFNAYFYILFSGDAGLRNKWNMEIKVIESDWEKAMTKGLFNNKTTRKGKVKINEYGPIAYKIYLVKVLIMVW